MSFHAIARHVLMDPRVRDHAADDEEMLGIHAEILARKTLMRSAFVSFYRQMEQAADKLSHADGAEIELGTGAGFFKELRPQVLTSDIRRGAKFDLVLDAQEMRLPDSSVRCLYAINVFHHLPQPDLFFCELIRVLRSGGICALIEPHGGAASALLHRYLHAEEIYDATATSWSNPLINGAMSGANQALSHIIFRRDLAAFQEKYGDFLEIADRQYCCNGFRYLLSGGLNFRQLVPSITEPLLRAIETIGKPLARHWTLHELVILRRTSAHYDGAPSAP